MLLQTQNSPRFNKGSLFNVGFLESSKDYDWDCFVLHDVDLVAEDDRNLYICSQSNPTHLGVGGSGIRAHKVESPEVDFSVFFYLKFWQMSKVVLFQKQIKMFPYTLYICSWHLLIVHKKHCIFSYLSLAVKQYGYKLFYDTLVGGALAFTPSQFVKVNGFSNQFWGWGCEDDDMWNRLVARNYTVERPPETIARYSS